MQCSCIRTICKSSRAQRTEVPNTQSKYFNTRKKKQRGGETEKKKAKQILPLKRSQFEHSYCALSEGRQIQMAELVPSSSWQLSGGWEADKLGIPEGRSKCQNRKTHSDRQD